MKVSQGFFFESFLAMYRGVAGSSRASEGCILGVFRV